MISMSEVHTSTCWISQQSAGYLKNVCRLLLTVRIQGLFGITVSAQAETRHVLT